MDELVRAEWARVVSWLTAKGVVRETAEDIAQEAFLSVWRRRDRIGGYPLRKALYITAQNCWIDNWRTQQRRAVTVAFDSLNLPVLIDFTERVETEEAISEVLRKLSQVELDVILRRARGMQYSEIALDLGIPLGTVKRRIHDARRAM